MSVAPFFPERQGFQHALRSRFRGQYFKAGDIYNLHTNIHYSPDQDLSNYVFGLVLRQALISTLNRHSLVPGIVSVRSLDAQPHSTQAMPSKLFITVAHICMVHIQVKYGLFKCFCLSHELVSNCISLKSQPMCPLGTFIGSSHNRQYHHKCVYYSTYVCTTPK